MLTPTRIRQRLCPGPCSRHRVGDKGATWLCLALAAVLRQQGLPPLPVPSFAAATLVSATSHGGHCVVTSPGDRPIVQSSGARRSTQKAWKTRNRRVESR
ncbi:hypothetical protein M8818_003502 [Zalaria obscura]|uniref:Uncharacterized protein n=1 Tax=Zalaria obscura TaxID=2024903 RepID=A0ACC3SEV3_9PEZI